MERVTEPVYPPCPISDQNARLDRSSTEYWGSSADSSISAAGPPIAVVVLSKIGHELSRRVIGSTLAGDGLLVRLRSTSIGLLGVVTATGLGLIAFVSNQSWPGALNSPLPVSPSMVSGIHGAVALDGTTSPTTSVTPARRVRTGATHLGPGAGGAQPGPSSAPGKLRGAHEAAGPAPAGQGAPAPAPQAPPSQPPVPSSSGPEGQGAVPVTTPASGAPPSPAPVASSADRSKRSARAAAGAANGKGGKGGKAESESRSSGPPKQKASPAERPARSAHAAVPPPAQSAPAAAPADSEGGSAPEQPGRGHAYGKSGRS